MATVTLDGVRKSYERRGGRQRGLRAARNARCGIILQSPGAISSTVFRRREAMLSTILRLFVGMTTTAKCHPARSWFLGIPASAVRKTSNPSRSAAVSNAPSCRVRHDMCMTVRTSWPGNMWRSWTGRHSSIRTGAHAADLTTSSEASARTARTSSRLRLGHDSKISSRLSPSARLSNKTATGTRVPRKHGVPPMISGSVEIRSDAFTNGFAWTPIATNSTTVIQYKQNPKAWPR